jgi:glutathione S-transferase
LHRIDPSKGEQKSPEHTARHPLQHLPVLETADGVIFESAALCLHLADLYPEKKLIPPPGSHLRALVYQWCFFAMDELEPRTIAGAKEKNRKDGPLDEAKISAEKEQIARILAPVDQLLSTREYLLGEFSVADVVLGGVAWWTHRLGLVDGNPNVKAWIDRLTARPAYKRATAD